MRLWICFMAVSSIITVAKAQGRVVCYFASWSLTRTGDSQYRIEDIDPYLCTHVIYAFANLASDGTIQVSDPSTDSSSGLELRSARPEWEVEARHMLDQSVKGGYHSNRCTLPDFLTVTEYACLVVTSKLQLSGNHEPHPTHHANSSYVATMHPILPTTRTPAMWQLCSPAYPPRKLQLCGNYAPSLPTTRILKQFKSQLRLKDGYNRLNRLKQQNPNLKTLIAVGGGSAGSAIFSQVFNNAALRAAFVAFADTLVALRNRFNPLGLILTVACPSPSYYIRVSYDITRIAQNVDFINLMTYDFHNGYQSTTGLNAPLYVRQTDPDKELNVYAGVENWLNNGAPAEKIVLGMGFYGTAFILTDSSNNGVGAPASGAGGSGGTLMYNQICQSQMVDDGWNINWDEEADVPFANRGTLWVGYDDPDSIAEKAQYALDKGLGGAMVWSVDMDDFRGNCGDKNVLLQKIKGIIG
ncbi:unnamed protein product [Timema podura]|uniref:GH18 domain-containing protein n=1 Tax=Timema podura TaxID=61482 RepID=A0ABN7P4B9_TIMPD|nr:unnamed protein product [Timema podura]